MKVHVLIDARHDVLAYVHVSDSWPQLVLAPLDHTHTLYEHVEVPDEVASLRGDEAFAVVREHVHRHLEILRNGG